jgi:hypothetical protein
VITNNSNANYCNINGNRTQNNDKHCYLDRMLIGKRVMRRVSKQR